MVWVRTEWRIAIHEILDDVVKLEGEERDVGDALEVGEEDRMLELQGQSSNATEVTLDGPSQFVETHNKNQEYQNQILELLMLLDLP